MKDIMAVALILFCIFMIGLMGYAIGTDKMEREVVRRGFATYDNQNGTTEVGKFKWKDEAQK